MKKCIGSNRECLYAKEECGFYIKYIESKIEASKNCNGYIPNLTTKELTEILIRKEKD